jgi:uncharacterized HhH-GPD family protein
VPEALYFTDSDEANRLIAAEPLALLIGFAIDQQVTVQQAFTGPLKLRERIGTLDAREIAQLAPESLEAAFRQTPAIHRFPRAMAQRVQELWRRSSCPSTRASARSTRPRTWPSTRPRSAPIGRLGGR